MIMAGGTGGHVYPALAVAERLRARKVPLFWLGTAHGLEARVAPEAGIELLTIRISGVRGKGTRRLLIAPAAILLALLQALRVCRKRRPILALGMGGFASGPGALAAWLLRIPLLVHEQNRIPGITNRALAHVATQVMQGFPDTFKAGALTTGNPVRAGIARLADVGTRAEGSTDTSLLKVLVLGGSQGAHRLNRVVPLALERLQRQRDLSVLHQCGRAHLTETEQFYAGLALQDVRVEAFITDMTSAYRWADLVICRAGAMTLAELCAAGLPSILIPLPHAVDDHQTANARYLSQAGAALLLPEDALTGARLAELLEQVCGGAHTLPGLAVCARKLARPDAAQKVAARCLEYIDA